MNVDEKDDVVIKAIMQIVCAYVKFNKIQPAELPDLIRVVSNKIRSLLRESGNKQEKSDRAKPALPKSKSVTKSELFCLECGKGFKTIKRHLKAYHGLSRGLSIKMETPTRL